MGAKKGLVFSFWTIPSKYNTVLPRTLASKIIYKKLTKKLFALLKNPRKHSFRFLCVKQNLEYKGVWSSYSNPGLVFHCKDFLCS